MSPARLCGSMPLTMKKERLWLFIVILAAFGLRLTRLGEQSLWYDEGVTWMLSQMRQVSDLIQWTAADIQPPLYYLLIWGTDIIYGHSEWALRFPSAVFNTLTVPLIYVVGQRLFAGFWSRRSAASLLAAGIFALSPLMIYYSQETRMYALLVFEATLASYLLLKIIHSDQTTPRRLSLWLSMSYAVTATAALYTHYFAAFVIAAHGLYILFILWRQQWPQRLLIEALIMFGLALLFFGPWLPTVLSRLGDDPSFWPGALKLDEAVRKVIISFTVGETVFEQTGFWLALSYLGLLVAASGWLIVNRYMFNKPAPPGQISIADQPATAVFLLLWLGLPPVLILALSYHSPKFNSRYTMLAWPALALITAGVLTGLLHNQPAGKQFNQPINSQIPALKQPEHDAPYFLRHASRILGMIFLLFILTTSAFSLFNWFTDPRFSKDDFQALAKFVQERIGPDETVLLSSGHLFPVWAYYYGWDNWTPLPWMQRLDVDQVTNLTVSTDLAKAVEGKTGVWLVTWQDEIIDPNGVVPFWLDLIGTRPDDAGDFWGVGLQHWQLDPKKIKLLSETPIKRRVVFDPGIGLKTIPIIDPGDIPAATLADNKPGDLAEAASAGSGLNFANRVELLGFTQLSDTDLVLFWRPLVPLPDDLVLTLGLTDSDGFSWDRQDFVGRPGAYLYPPSRWPVGEIVMTRHQLDWQIGTPPGLYSLQIELGQLEPATAQPQTAQAAADYVGWDILDDRGRPFRRTGLIDLVNLSDLVEPESGPLPLDNDPLVDFFPIVGVRRSILPQKTAEPGDQIFLALLWQAGEFNLDNISIAFDLVDSDRQTFRVGSSLTPSRRYYLPLWKPGDMVLGQYRLDIPSEAAAGPASIQLHLIHAGAFPYDEVFQVGEIEVLPTERNFTPPEAIDIPIEANFSDQVILLGLDCQADAGADCHLTPGRSLELTFYWQINQPPTKNYTVFTHLLDAGETVVVNADHAPPKPTQGWVTGEIVADPVSLAVPVDLPSGDYRIEVGLYDAADPNFGRLPLATGETRLILPQTFTIKSAD